MLNIYLHTARYLLICGYRDQAMDYLTRALIECNRDLSRQLERKHVMAAISYVRRIPDHDCKTS